MHTEDHLEDFCKEYEGNWKEFDSFGWRNDYIEDPDRWGIRYTSNRDSSLIDKSNEAVIDKIMEPFVNRGVAFHESHNHFACGHIDGYSFMVRTKKGKPTAVARALCEIALSLANYPLLDESDHSEREYEAAMEGIRDNFPSDIDIDLIPENWEAEVFDWLWDNNQRELENSDDQGAYPSTKAVQEAINALWPETVEQEDDDE